MSYIASLIWSALPDIIIVFVMKYNNGVNLAQGGESFGEFGFSVTSFWRQ